jgi:hypothetical protein
LPRDERGAIRIRSENVRIADDVGGGAHGRSAGRHDLSELAALKEHHLRAEATAPGDPPAELRGIYLHHRRAGGEAIDLSAIDPWQPGGVEAEHRLGVAQILSRGIMPTTSVQADRQAPSMTTRSPAARALRNRSA